MMWTRHHAAPVGDMAHRPLTPHDPMGPPAADAIGAAPPTSLPPAWVRAALVAAGAPAEDDAVTTHDMAGGGQRRKKQRTKIKSRSTTRSTSSASSRKKSAKDSGAAAPAASSDSHHKRRSTRKSTRSHAHDSVVEDSPEVSPPPVLPDPKPLVHAFVQPTLAARTLRESMAPARAQWAEAAKKAAAARDTLRTALQHAYNGTAAVASHATRHAWAVEFGSSRPATAAASPMDASTSSTPSLMLRPHADGTVSPARLMAAAVASLPTYARMRTRHEQPDSIRVDRAVATVAAWRAVPALRAAAYGWLEGTWRATADASASAEDAAAVDDDLLRRRPRAELPWLEAAAAEGTADATAAGGGRRRQAPQRQPAEHEEPQQETPGDASDHDADAAADHDTWQAGIPWTLVLVRAVTCAILNAAARTAVEIVLVDTYPQAAGRGRRGSEFASAVSTPCTLPPDIGRAALDLHAFRLLTSRVAAGRRANARELQNAQAAAAAGVRDWMRASGTTALPLTLKIANPAARPSAAAQEDTEDAEDDAMAGGGRMPRHSHAPAAEVSAAPASCVHQQFGIYTVAPRARVPPITARDLVPFVRAWVAQLDANSHGALTAATCAAQVAAVIGARHSDVRRTVCDTLLAIFQAREPVANTPFPVLARKRQRKTIV